MTLDNVISAFKNGQKVGVPYFDGAQVELFVDGDDEAFLKLAAGAAMRFLKLEPSDRLTASRHVHAYYEDYRDAVGGEDWMDDEMGRVLEPDNIWQHVRPIVLQVLTEKDENGADIPYVVLEANCDWETEHGLMMSWRDGTELVKVGGYDGSPLNGYPGAEEGHKYVYWGNPSFRTRASSDPAD